MLATMPKRRDISSAHGPISFLEAGSGQPLVLLHGIGACAAAWQAQLTQFAHRYRVIAWDAPGYGASAPLVMARPAAEDYADALAALFAAARIERPHVLGHSLGAIMAAAWAGRTDADARSLLLASPARGYGASEPPKRQAVYAERVKALAELGIDGLAAARAPQLCAAGADEAVVRRVRENMTQITPRGYRHAAWLLSTAVLQDYLSCLRAPAAVFCGSEDGITTPQACADVARLLNTDVRILPGVGHACYVEAPAEFNAAVLASLRSIEETRP